MFIATVDMITHNTSFALVLTSSDEWNNEIYVDIVRRLQKKNKIEMTNIFTSWIL